MTFSASPTANETLKNLILILSIKALIALLLIAFGPLSLGPDEAQYWTWSQALDWGYYSKPPGIAWQIGVGTLIFGNTELGVQSMSVIINFFTSLSLYFLAKSCRLQDSTAFWAALAFAFSPLGLLGSVLATTDGGLVFFWTLACMIFARALSAKTTPNYLLIGLLIACGALFKWPIYLFWIFVAAAAYLNRSLRSPSLILGGALSLLGLLPSVIWNSQHEWATLRHVLSTVKGGHAHTASSGNFWDFIGAQAALASPIIFVLMVLAVVYAKRHARSILPSLLFCAAVTALLVSVYSLLALRQKMQGNWVIFAYPTGFVLAAWYALERTQRGRKWLIGGVIFSAALSIVAFTLPFTGWLPYKVNPFKHQLGWDRLDEKLLMAGYDPHNHFVFSDKYQMSSLLSFYAPEQKRAYFLNVRGDRKNQFSYWPSLADERSGQTGFYVAVVNQHNIEAHLGKLSPFFSHIEVAGVYPLIQQNGEAVKNVLILKCAEYNGKQPVDRQLY